MKDDSLPEPGPESAPESGQEQEQDIYVPATALKVQDKTPNVGDDVEFTVTGTVKELHGDTVCVTPSEMNGEPAPKEPSDEPDEDDMGAMESKLGNQAAAMDSQGAYG